MLLIKKGFPLATAAVKAGMSEGTARKYRRLGKPPSEVGAPHGWRTRSDPFEAVWAEAEALLEQDNGLQAKTVFEELQRRHPGQYQAGQLRTLQRRFRHWRALHGADKEVYFAQVHRPGEQCQSDFTGMDALGVTIAGDAFPHLLYHFVLTYSNWESVSLCYSETFEALSEGFRGRCGASGVCRRNTARTTCRRPRTSWRRAAVGGSRSATKSCWAITGCGVRRTRRGGRA